MISGGCAFVFGIFAAIMGAIFVWYGLTEPYWAALVVGLAFLTWAFFVVRNSFAWMRLTPAESLLLFEDHFCVGSRRFPYSAFRSVQVQRTRTRKTLNFLPAGVDETVVAELALADRVIRLRAGAGPARLFGASIGRPAADKLLKTLELLKWRASHPNEALDFTSRRETSR